MSTASAIWRMKQRSWTHKRMDSLIAWNADSRFSLPVYSMWLVGLSRPEIGAALAAVQLAPALPFPLPDREEDTFFSSLPAS